MFEQSLLESSKVMTATSKYWPFISFFANCAGMVALILWPLVHPEALPTQMMATLMVAPSPPPSPPPPIRTSKVQIKSEMLNAQLQAPSRIPKEIKTVNESAIPPSMEGVNGVEDLGKSTPGGLSAIIGTTGTGSAPTVNPPAPRKLSISSGVMDGYLLDKTVPQYPAIAKAARIQGTVVLQATIAKTGLIQNLRVISGPPMLQQAAIDAVRSWRYKPYLLNGDPVEVETTINVVFSLGE
jgi:periplasmic protein TonB